MSRNDARNLKPGDKIVTATGPAKVTRNEDAGGGKRMISTNDGFTQLVHNDKSFRTDTDGGKRK